MTCRQCGRPNPPAMPSGVCVGAAATAVHLDSRDCQVTDDGQRFSLRPPRID